MGTRRSVAFGLLWILLAVAEASSNTGTLIEAWVGRYNGPANDYDEAVAVAVSPAGDIVVSGSSIGSNGYLEYTTIDYSSAGLPLWTNRYDGPGHAYNLVTSMAVDATIGNIYVTGGSFGTNGGDDFATVAYSRAGEPLWTNRYNAPFHNSAGALAVAVGPEGNVYVAGSVVSGGYATVAYTSKGMPVWTNMYAVTNYSTGDIVEAMAVDPSGTVYVTGWSDPGDGTADYATLAYSGDGKPLWTNRYNGPADGIDVALAIAVDRFGHVFVSGYSEGNGSHLDYATIAYSGTGVPLWTNRYNGSGNNTDIAKAMAVDNDGRVYVAGYSYNSGATFDSATIAYSWNGMPLWTNRYQGPDHLDSGGAAVVVDGYGRVIVAGSSYATGVKDDFTAIVYSADGAPLSTNRYNGPANGYDYVDSKCGLAPGSDGAIYLAGTSEGVNGGLTNADFAIIKYVTVPDILLGRLQRVPDACRFSITAPTNTPYRLEASEDLTNWQTLTNFPPLPVPSIEYSDTLAQGFVQRFYRAVWSP